MNLSDNRTVGERLREAREALNLGLADAAIATSIKYHHLQELENDHPEVFTSGVQARGFLRLYAAFLNLNASELIAIWDKPLGGEPPIKSKKEESQQSADPFHIASTADEPVENGEPSSNDSQVISTPSSDGEEPGKNSETYTAENGQSENRKGLFSRVQIPERVKRVLLQIPLPDFVAKILTKIRLALPHKAKNIAEVEIPRELSGDIFKEIGAALRDRRLVMDLNLSDIEHFTNLKRMVLLAIEDGRFNDLPSTVQGRGMLNNYAQFLAMDDSAVMDRYALALQLQREERMPARKAPQPAVSVKVNLPEGLRKVLNPDLVIGGALILALFGFILWGASQMLGSGSGTATDAPSISEMLRLTPSVSPTFDQTGTAQAEALAQEVTEVPGVFVAERTPTPVATANAAPLQLYIIAHDRAYLRITVDGVSAFDGRVIPDNVYTYSGNDLITLLTGNGAALEIYFNQDYLGNLGAVGEVVNLRFSLKGLQTPTPNPLPTPSATLPVEGQGAPAEGN